MLAAYALKSAPLLLGCCLPNRSGWKSRSRGDSRGGDRLSLSITEVTPVLNHLGTPVHGAEPLEEAPRTGSMWAASTSLQPHSFQIHCSSFWTHPATLTLSSAPPLAKDFCPFSLGVSSSGRNQGDLWAWRLPAQVALSAGPGGARVFWGAVMPWPSEQLGQSGEGESSSRRN